MRVYGNLTNRISETVAPDIPKVGMGATIILYSDRYAATIVEVRGKSVYIQQDKAIRTDANGVSDSQTYRYEPNKSECIERYTLRKNGCYVKYLESMKNGTILRVGVRDHYYDYNF